MSLYRVSVDQELQCPCEKAYWQLFVMSENELSFSLDQFPLTYECAKW